MINISYVIILIGIILVICGAIFSHRKGESEISTSFGSHPAFKIGLIVAIIGVVARIVLNFI